MKKTAWVLTLILLVTGILTSCGTTGTEAVSDAQSGETEDLDVTESADTQAEEPADSTGGNSLVVYFSRTGEQYNVGVIGEGNTAIVAKEIAKQTGADLFEILPQEDTYPTTYDELTEVAKQEQSEGARPAYQEEGMPDLSQYDTIYIGAPVWWDDWPMIMYTFFEVNRNGLAGKTLYPFSTHEGSGLAGFDQKLAGACPDSTVEEGLAIQGQTAQSDRDAVKAAVEDWLK